MAINFSIGRTLWFHFNSSLQVNKVCRCSRFLKSNKDFWFHGSFELTVEDLSDKLQMALSPFFFFLSQAAFLDVVSHEVKGGKNI